MQAAEEGPAAPAIVVERSLIPPISGAPVRPRRDHATVAPADLNMLISHGSQHRGPHSAGCNGLREKARRAALHTVMNQDAVRKELVDVLDLNVPNITSFG